MHKIQSESPAKEAGKWRPTPSSFQLVSQFTSLHAVNWYKLFTALMVVRDNSPRHL
jgi:hypothetical protein